MNGLSERELEVLEHLCAGKRNRQIADELFVGQETVKSHLKSIYRKLGVSSRTEAVAQMWRGQDLSPGHYEVTDARAGGSR